MFFKASHCGVLIASVLHYIQNTVWRFDTRVPWMIFKADFLMILFNLFFSLFKQTFFFYLICCLILDLALVDHSFSCNLFIRCHEKIIFFPNNEALSWFRTVSRGKSVCDLASEVSLVLLKEQAWLYGVSRTVEELDPRSVLTGCQRPIDRFFGGDSCN